MLQCFFYFLFQVDPVTVAEFLRNEWVKTDIFLRLKIALCLVKGLSWSVPVCTSTSSLSVLSELVVFFVSALKTFSFGNKSV